MERLSSSKPNRSIATRERALAMAQAAEELGGVAVSILANEGEEYSHVNREGRIYEGKVPEGKVYVQRAGSGRFDTAYHDRVDKIHEELTQIQQRAA